MESSDVVGKGRVQLETSLAWARDRQGSLKTRETSTPTLLRLGIADAWEYDPAADAWRALPPMPTKRGAAAAQRESAATAAAASVPSCLAEIMRPPSSPRALPADELALAAAGLGIACRVASTVS